jgi:hypothetical protein
MKPGVDVSTAEAFKSVIEVEVDNEQPWWALEGDGIRAALIEHYGSDVAGHALTPPRDASELRARLREAAPRLAELTDRIRHAFDVEGACAVLVPELGLREVDVDTKRKGVFALATLIGDPSANIPFDEVFWDVQNHGDASTKHSSFSENDREAVYHTDNGALRIPERFFLLYVVQEARCGGGLSMIKDGRALISELEETPEGREAVRTLTESVVPRRIPKAFREYAYGLVSGYQHTPVFGDVPLVRWRTDKIYDGLVKRPEFATPEVVKAVDMVADRLDNGTAEVYQAVPTDGLILINNHIALHGRTAFSDPARHLLRLRFHDPLLQV